METTNTTKEIVNKFYEAKSHKGEWQTMFSDEVTFKGTGMHSLKGKQSVIEITNDLLTRLESYEMKNIFEDDDTATVLNNYHLISPKGDRFILETAEIVKVENGKINSFDVYFDTASSGSFMAKFQNE